MRAFRRSGLLAVVLVAAACAEGDAYYEPCSEDDPCPDGSACVRLAGEEFCSPRCGRSDECAEAHGARSYCARIGVCLTACMEGDSCPEHTTCGMEGVCDRL